MTKKHGLPDRWLKYKNMSRRIAGTPFVAFKVPLSENFFRKRYTAESFTPGAVVESNPAMRLIIDLTNTHRYYTPESVESKGVYHCKLACPGRKIPNDGLISRFCDIVHDFLSGSADGQDTLIGVHCTHGVNRTGFFICSFMIRHLLMHPREAINAFETARGHQIERQEYVEALMRQYSSSGLGRKRRTPPRGPPPVAAAPDAGGHRIERYGFGTLPIAAPASTTGSWTITTLNSGGGAGPQASRWVPAPDPEAGPSRKRGPNEPYAPSPPRAHHKGKKDKRSKKKRGQSTSGTEGEDVRSESGHAAPASADDHNGAQSRRSLNANGERNQRRENPAYGSSSWKKIDVGLTPSHLAPPPPQTQYQPRLPPPQFPSSHPSAAERGFGHWVERERGPGPGPTAPRGGGGDRRGGGAWNRGRGHGEESGAAQGRYRVWGRAGGRGGQRERTEQFDQRKGWVVPHSPHWNNRRQHPYARGHE